MLTKTKLAIALAAFGLGLAAPSFARHGADDPKGDIKGEGIEHPVAVDVEIVARRGRGADDKPGDDRGVHAPGHPVAPDFEIVARRGRGADDAPGHIRREDRRADRRQS